MRAALISILFLFHALHGTGFSQGARGVVKGRIVSTEGLPLAGVRVAAMEAKDTDEGHEGTALLAGIGQTDENGRYSLEDLPSGRYYIVAGKLDRVSYFPGVNAPTRASVIPITSGATVSGVDFWITAPLNVTGRVVGNDSPRASVMQLIPISVGVASTSVSTIEPDGSFEFRDVQPGLYTFQPNTRIDFAVAIPPGHSPEGQPNILLVDDRSIPGVFISVASPLKGQIAMDREGPVPPFTLDLVDATGHTFSTTVSSERPFSVALFEGEYTVSIRSLPDGYNVKSIRYEDKDILHSRFLAKGTLGEITVNLSISEPPPWARIHGRVALPSGEFSTMAFAFWIPGAPWRRQEVRPDGTFDIALLPGSYRVQMEGYFPDFVLKSFSDGKLDLTKDGININWRDVINLVAVIEPVPSVKISGVVKGLENLRSIDPSRPPTVELLRLGRIQRFEQAVRPDGTFEFINLPPGFYRIGLPEDSAVARTFIVDADHDISGVEVSIPAQIRVTGRVAIDDAGPLPDLSAMAIMAMGPHATAGASVHSDGTFAFSSTEGEQQIAARSIPPGYLVQSVTWGAIDLEQQSIKPTGHIEVRVILKKR